MEIEIRAKITNLKDLSKRVVALGAKLVKEKNQTDVYYGSICLYEKNGYSFLIRVRNEDGEIFLAYKGAKTKKDGEWEEHEFQIKNENEAKNMLEAMGLEKIVEVRKKRKEYDFGNFSICFDNIKGLGNFVEIECISTNAKLAKQKINGLMRQLGISKDKSIEKGYVTLLLAKTRSAYSQYIRN